MKKFSVLINRGYNIKYIWELDWNEFQKGLTPTPKIYENCIFI